MPCRVNTSRQNGVIFHVNLTHQPIIGYHSATIFLARMELHSFRTILLIIMAVNALSTLFWTAQHIIIDNILIVVFQTALIDRQILITDIGWWDKSITQMGIYRVRWHINIKWLITRPLVIVTCKHLNLDGLSISFFNQLFPIISIWLNCRTTNYQLFVTNGISSHHLICLHIHLKCQRSHIDRDCHILIVWIDIWFRTWCHIVCWHLGITSHQKQ